jgi:hypothetical protein
MAATLAEGEIIRAGVRLVRFDLGAGTRVDVATAEGPSWIWTGRSQIPVPFTANAGFALSGDEVHIVAGPSFRVTVFEDGRLSRIYGVEREERAVTRDAVDDYRDFIEEFYPAEQHAALLSALGHPTTPSVMPAYTGVVVSSSGEVWAARYSPRTLWDVFGPEGELRGQVEMPPDFYPMSVRGRRLAGVWRDDVGVEYVRVYEMGS